MAIAFDAQATSSYLWSPWTGLSYNHTCTWSDRILFVMTANNWATTTTTAVTYNGVSMTSIWSIRNSNNSLVTLWYLIAPATWSNTITTTTSAAANQIAKSVSYTWVQQSSQPDAFTVNWPTTTTSFTQSVTTVANNCWLIAASAWMSWLTITAGANTTIRNVMELSLAWSFILDSNSAQTPAGSKSMNVTSSSQQFTWVMASFSPATASVQTNPTFILNFI